MYYTIFIFYFFYFQFFFITFNIFYIFLQLKKDNKRLQQTEVTKAAAKTGNRINF